MVPAMLCKTSKQCKHVETRGKTIEIKLKLACILEASESTRLRMEESLPNHHEDHIAGKTLDYNITIWYTNLFLWCLKQWKYQQQKQQWIKNGRHLKRFQRGTWLKSEVKKRWSMKPGRRAQKFILHHFNGHMSFEDCRIGDKAPKIQRSSCTRRRHCEGWFWILCCVYRTRIISITNDSSKSQQAADAVSACTQVKMEDAPELLKIPKSECPDIWIRLPRHKWPKSWSSMEDPVVPLERNLYGHPLAGLFWEKQFEKILLKYGWEKVSNWECLFVHLEKGICVCGWHQIGWKETILIRCGKD